VRELVQAPPICFPTHGDQETIQILEDFGKSLKREDDEINQACNLATGFSDIVIILERPRDRRWHKFNVPFEQFVQDCRTLTAVDELIRFASKGARSIYTVTVLNAFSYQPYKNNKEQDRRCHEALAQMLRAKKPRVVIRCHCDEYEEEWLKHRLDPPAKEYRLERTNVELTKGHTTVVLKSFHPSCAVNYAGCRPELRALLIYHFVAAFSELISRFNLPESAEKIRELRPKNREPRINETTPLRHWETPEYISNALGPRVLYMGFANETSAGLRMRRIRAFNRMYGSLKRLFAHSQDYGTLGIAKAVLLWKQLFQQDALYKQTMSWLILCGNQQWDWFACPAQGSSSHLTLEGKLSGLTITEPTIAHQYKEINKKAAHQARMVFARFKQAKCLETTHREETIAVFKEHNHLIDNHIRNLSISKINDAIQIKSLVICCEEFESTLRAEPQTLEREELRNLFPCLRQLAQHFGH
jgi:hypothetical protein